MIRVAIGGKSKALLSHLTKEPPEKTSETYETWEQEDLIVFSWLIQNIEPIIAGNLTEYPTVKALWDALVTRYSGGKDKLQIFNLHVKANELKQNEKSLEEFWIALQGVWGEIDRIDPNPMKCAEDIKTYSEVRSEQKLFQFLHGLNQGVGLAIKGYRRNDGKKPFVKEDKSHLTCEECGMTKHAKEQCFRFVGYPNWWTDDHKKGTKNYKSEKEKKGFPTIQPSTSNKENTKKGFGG
nr:hypothetical protein [Tanacetum cinerariifolium]